MSTGALSSREVLATVGKGFTSRFGVDLAGSAGRERGESVSTSSDADIVWFAPATASVPDAKFRLSLYKGG